MRGCLRACVGQEVFRSDKTDNVAFSKVIGKCYVMSVKEYFKNKPEVTFPAKHLHVPVVSPINMCPSDRLDCVFRCRNVFISTRTRI